MRLALPASITAFVGVLALVGCGEPRQVGDVFVQGSVTSYDFYGEYREKRDNGKDRVFLILDPATAAAFAEGAKELPLSKTLIAAGPSKETIVIEQVKDPAQSQIIARRLIRTFNERNNGAVKLP